MDRTFNDLLGKNRQTILKDRKQEGNIYNAGVWYYGMQGETGWGGMSSLS